MQLTLLKLKAPLQTLACKRLENLPWGLFLYHVYCTVAQAGLLRIACDCIASLSELMTRNMICGALFYCLCNDMDC